MSFILPDIGKAETEMGIATIIIEIFQPLFTHKYFLAFLLLLHLSASKYNHELKEWIQGTKVPWMLDEEPSLYSFNFLFKLSLWLLVFL